MTQVNPNINQYYAQQYMQNQQSQQQVKLPKYYDVSNNYNQVGFKETLQDSLVYEMMLKPFVEHPIAVLMTWLGYGVVADAYSKACGGDYEKSLVKKVANAGDKLQNSRIIQNKPVQTVLGGAKKVGQGGKKLVKHSAILRSMKNTPTQPEWALAKSQMFNQKQEVVQDFLRVTDTLGLTTHDVPKLKDLGMNSVEKNMLKSVFNVKRVSEIPQEKAVNQLLLHRLGVSSEKINKIQAVGTGSNRIVKDMILNEMGLDAEKLKLMKEDIYGKYIDEAKEAAGRVKGRVKIGAGHYKPLGPLTKPFERTIGCDEIYNKLHSMSGGAKTETGRFLSKAMQMVHRGLTFGGGKLGGLIFISPILVETFVNVLKADKDQKVGTAAGGIINNISWVFTFPLAFKIMHSIGGIKYAGMTEEQVRQVRTLKQNFNEKAGSGFIDRLKVLFGMGELKPCKFANKTEYEIAKAGVKEEIKNLTKVKGQNIFTKALRKIAGVLTLDLENLRGYHGGGTASKFYHDLPHLMKDGFGIPLRFIILGCISMGVLDALIEKGSTAVFGKSYDSMKQDERKNEKKEQQRYLMEDLNNRMYEKQKNKLQKARQKVIVPQNNVSSRGKNSAYKIPVEKDVKVDNYTYIPSQDSTILHPARKNGVDDYTYIPSSECTIESDKQKEQNRKYIPSQAAANINKTWDNSGLQSALDRAQRAEEQALKVLAGNFDGM